MTAERCSPVLADFDPEAYEIGIEFGTRTALRAKQAYGTANFLADVSAFRRRLFVGSKAAPWLSANGIDSAPGLLDVSALPGGALLAQIHADQYLLIDGPDAGPAEHLFELAEGRHGDVLVLPYEAAEFACGGPDVDRLIAELCPANVAAIPGTVWNATRLAHCEVALRRCEGQQHYRILCSPADARFLFGVLSEITGSRDGAVIGLDDYRTWLRRED